MNSGGRIPKTMSQRQFRDEVSHQRPFEPDFALMHFPDGLDQYVRGGFLCDHPARAAKNG